MYLKTNGSHCLNLPSTSLFVRIVCWYTDQSSTWKVLLRHHWRRTYSMRSLVTAVVALAARKSTALVMWDAGKNCRESSIRRKAWTPEKKIIMILV